MTQLHKVLVWELATLLHNATFSLHLACQMSFALVCNGVTPFFCWRVKHWLSGSIKWERSDWRPSYPRQHRQGMKNKWQSQGHQSVSQMRRQKWIQEFSGLWFATMEQERQKWFTGPVSPIELFIRKLSHGQCIKSPHWCPQMVCWRKLFTTHLTAEFISLFTSHT